MKYPLEDEYHSHVYELQNVDVIYTKVQKTIFVALTFMK